MSGWLLDVNVLLGCAWKSHADHPALLGWLLRANHWATCSIVELGFLRVSMTSAYDASFADAQRSLATLRALGGHQFASDDVNSGSLPILTSYKDTTDAHLVTLAKRHGLKLATLDTALIAKSWATGIAENPLRSMAKPAL
ncbi:MAG: PIN domain-containing protein [Bryobacteraceae bacterium]